MHTTARAFAAIALTLVQATIQLTQTVAASAKVPSLADDVPKIIVQFRPTAPDPVRVLAKRQPDFAIEVLAPLRSAQAAEAKQELPRLSRVANVIRPRLVGPVTGDTWYQLRLCEAGNDYARNSGNGFYGAYQFALGTWSGYHTGYARPDLAPPEVQDAVAHQLQSSSGWSPWPACARKLGLM